MERDAALSVRPLGRLLDRLREVRGPAAILVGAGLVHGLLLLWTPGFSFDEGTYVARGLTFSSSGVLYTRGFWDHPFLGWAILGTVYRAVDFPGLPLSLSAGSLRGMWVLPRVMMVIFALVNALLVFRIAGGLLANERQALVAMTLFAFSPLALFSRMVLLDNIGLTFLLGAILAALERSGARRHLVMGAASGVLFAAAVLTKLSFLAFLPMFIGILVFPKRLGLPGAAVRHPFRLWIWTASWVAVLAVWPVYAIVSGAFDALVAGQVWQLGRSEGFSAPELFGYLIVRDPILAIPGIYGAYTLAKRGNRLIPLWLLSYAAFLAAISVHYDHYLIPLGAPLAICASVPVEERIIPWVRRWDARREGRRARLGPSTLRRLLVLGAAVGMVTYGVGMTLTNTGPQEEAYRYVVSNAAPGALVIASPGYLWALRLVRPDLILVNWFDVTPEGAGASSDVTLVVDSQFALDLDRVPFVRALYDRSLPVARFGLGFGSVEVRETVL